MVPEVVDVVIHIRLPELNVSVLVGPSFTAALFGLQDAAGLDKNRSIGC